MAGFLRRHYPHQVQGVSSIIHRTLSHRGSPAILLDSE